MFLKGTKIALTGLSIFALSAEAQNSLVFSIYPYHTQVAVENLATDEVVTQTGAGAEVAFELPAGEYRYEASASGHCAVSGTLSVPENQNPSVFLSQTGAFGCSLAWLSGGGTLALYFGLGFVAFLLLNPGGRLGRLVTGSSPHVRFTFSRSLLGANLLVALVALAGAYAFHKTRSSVAPAWTGLLLALAMVGLGQAIFKAAYLLTKRGVAETWRRVAAGLEQQNGAVWSYRQPTDNVHIMLATSQKTELSYLLALERQQGVLSLEYDGAGNRKKAPTPKRLERKLTVLDRRLEAVRHDVLATLEHQETLFIYLPNVASGKFGTAKTDKHTFGFGHSLYVCERLEQFVDQIAAQERWKQEQIARLEFGDKTEREAAADLENALPDGWKLETEIMLPVSVGGDMDARLIIPERRSVVIEIKSYIQSLRATSEGLQKYDGSSVERDIQQIRRNARHYRAKAVLWLPNASFKPFNYQDITVFAGDAKALYRYLGGAPKANSS